MSLQRSYPWDHFKVYVGHIGGCQLLYEESISTVCPVLNPQWKCPTGLSGIL